MWCDREGKRVSSFGRSGRLKTYCTQLNHSTLPRILTFTYTVDMTFISSIWNGVISCFRCAASDICREMSICCFVYCALFSICVQSCDGGRSDWEL